MEEQTRGEWYDRRKPLDPMIYKPKYYVNTVNVISEANGTGAAAITLDNTPFILDSVQHGILGIDDPVKQDGQYTLLWRDDQTTYSNVQGAADLMFGSVRSGYIVPLPLRTFYQGSMTLTVEITNLLDRTADFPNTVPIQIVFIGFEKWSRPRL